MKKVKYMCASDFNATVSTCRDPRGVLEIGTVYELSRDPEVRSWHTRYYLKGYKGFFNSACFDQ